MSQEWVVGRERSNAAAIRLLVSLAFTFGRSTGRLLLYPICAYFLVFSIKSRTASRKYLAKVLGRAPGMRDLFRHYYYFAAVALDRMFLLRGHIEKFDVRVQGDGILLEALSRGQGCFLLGAHLGSFEVLRTLSLGKRVKVSLAMFENASRNVNEIARVVNPELDSAVIRLGAPNSMLKLHERIEHGEWVGMLGDRALGETSCVRVPFLGESASISTAPFRIAAILGQPVVLMIALYRGGNRYDVCFERLVDAPARESGNRDQSLYEFAERYAQRLEHYCRQAPYNWFNFYDFWAEANPAK